MNDIGPSNTFMRQSIRQLRDAFHALNLNAPMILVDLKEGDPSPAFIFGNDFEHEENRKPEPEMMVCGVLVRWKCEAPGVLESLDRLRIAFENFHVDPPAVVIDGWRSGRRMAEILDRPWAQTCDGRHEEIACAGVTIIWPRKEGGVETGDE